MPSSDDDDPLGDLPAGDGAVVSRRNIVGALGAATLLGRSGVVAGGEPAAATKPTDVVGDNSFRLPGDLARSRTVVDRFSERISVLDFDVDPNGRNDSTAGFLEAFRQAGAGEVFIPHGRYLVQELAVLGPAGRRIIGESRYGSVLASEAGGKSIFSSAAASQNTSAFHLICDLMFDLGGHDITAIDLASVNASVIERIHVHGGGAGNRRGIGVRFAAPLRKGAYDNALYDCSFEYLERGVFWDTRANNNAAYNCRATNCTVGFDAAPPVGVDTPRLFGGRVEQCGVGLREGASFGGYFGVRFEGSEIADIEFVATSHSASFYGGYTAGSKQVLKDVDLAESPQIESGDLGFLSIEESDARPRISAARHVFGRAGKAPPASPQRDYAAYFHDYVLLGATASLDISGRPDRQVIAVDTDSEGNLTISGFDRATRRFRRVNLGGGPSVRPLGNATTDLGEPRRAWNAIHLSAGVNVGGKRVLGERQPAIADDPTGGATSAKVNQILAALRRMGIIES